jgi:hypothetical protein
VRDVVIDEFISLFNLVITVNLPISVLIGIRKIEEWISKVGFNQKSSVEQQEIILEIY